jgi:hypothetical protein
MSEPQGLVLLHFPGGSLRFPKARVEYDRPQGTTIWKESTPLWNPVKTILKMHFFLWITLRRVLSR